MSPAAAGSTRRALGWLAVGAAVGGGCGPGVPVRYRSADEDSARWAGFPFCAGDIVISTRSKHGTTWMQMICALLVFGGPPAEPLSRLSPWLDALFVPRDELVQTFQAQRHRRFIKTHTPLDGLPLDDRATYIVVARDPLDAAVSLYHQGANLDRDKMRELIQQSRGGQSQPELPAAPKPPSEALLTAWLREWIASDADPHEELDSLPGVIGHLSDAWSRRDVRNVVLCRYADLVSDLDGQMRWLAGRLGVSIPAGGWPGLVAAAQFTAMRQDAARFVPVPGVIKDSAAFFRRGRPGAARELLDQADLALYSARLDQLAPKGLLAWLNAD